jgi:hypothetical protein
MFTAVTSRAPAAPLAAGLPLAAGPLGSALGVWLSDAPGVGSPLAAVDGAGVTDAAGAYVHPGPEPEPPLHAAASAVTARSAIEAERGERIGGVDLRAGRVVEAGPVVRI